MDVGGGRKWERDECDCVCVCVCVCGGGVVERTAKSFFLFFQPVFLSNRSSDDAFKCAPGVLSGHEVSRVRQFNYR